MNTWNTTSQEQQRAEHIRRQYIPREDNKIEQLRKLDNKVKTPGRIVASILGILGALVMGAGMSLVMVWGNMTTGLALSIPGLLVALLAYPVYSLILNSRKKKYAAQIMQLSSDLMNG